MYDLKLSRIAEQDRNVPATIVTIDGAFISNALRTKLNLPETTRGVQLASAVFDHSIVIPGFDADADDFNLTEVLTSLSLDFPECVYINFMHFENVDKLDFEILVKFFDDIWYPLADDMDIIDVELNWLILVHHEGYLYFLDLRS